MTQEQLLLLQVKQEITEMDLQTIRSIANEILSSKVMRIADLIEHEFSKIAMTTNQLLHQTSERSIKYARGCIATSKRNQPTLGRWSFSVRCNQNKSKGPYTVKIVLKKTGKPTQNILDREIKVSCNCNAWKYNGADFNALQKDYSESQYSNRQPPNKRDPTRRYLICKHIAASVPLFRRFLIPKEFKRVQEDTKQPITQQKPVTKQPITQLKPVIKQPIIKRPTLQKNITQKPKTPIKPIRPEQREQQ